MRVSSFTFQTGEPHRKTLFTVGASATTTNSQLYVRVVQTSFMLPAFVVPETVIGKNGESGAVSVEGASGLLLFTLGILEVVEQEALLLGMYGSPDGETWDAHPAVEFPEKFYSGVSAVLIDMKEHPGVRFVRAQWKVNRWGRGDKQPRFRLYLFVEAL